ncbi:MAG: ferredoxin:glutaredoxin reductase [Eubacteriaceae bacterium]|nr:ferredoxin:glutaredoxin reductase [Eubacteriaceae bacterium]
MTDREKVLKFVQELKTDAEKSGYHLNPDSDFVEDLGEGLLVNKDRYGYISCPCRLSKGIFKEDKDIICPCDYRDDDLNDYGSCYCALYVTQEIIDGRKELKRVPERRNPIKKAEIVNSQKSQLFQSKYPIWRCSVCGYICARNNPPEVCPICKAQKERFDLL